jgi:uncharacterized protein (DUF2384 family)
LKHRPARKVASPTPRLKSIQGGKTVAAEAGTTTHAIAVFGDRAKAMDWLKTPTHLLGGKSPAEFAKGGGAAEVDKILTRIEYGVFS